MANNGTTQFKKGHKGLKPKGAVSKKTRMWEDLGSYIVNEGAEKAMNYLMTLGDKDFFDRFNLMLEYFKPKQSRVQQDITSNGKTIVPILGGFTTDVHSDNSNSQTPEVKEEN